MVRWEPGARERLQQAALELYAARGFEQTTAADVAAAVGLSERTFFRHFADKREVVFGGQDAFAALFVDAIDQAPGDADVRAWVEAALAASTTFFPDERRPHARLRAAVIAANPGLQERELHKMMSLGVGIADALRRRGVPDPQATVAAESCVTVFTIAFGRWHAEGETRSLAAIEADVLAALRAFAA